MTYTRISLGLGLMLALLAWSASLSAQGRNRVRVAIIPELTSANVRAEILRFSSPGEPDIILLRSERATAKDLAVALQAYRALPTAPVSADGRIGRVAITTHDGGAGVSASLLRRADEMLRRLASTRPSRIGNLGFGRWEEFDVQQ